MIIVTLDDVVFSAIIVTLDYVVFSAEHRGDFKYCSFVREKAEKSV